MAVWYVIPARRDSKGIRYKNRRLFFFTADILPDSEKDRVIVTTDDEEIEGYAEKYGFTCLHRSEPLSDDHASMKDVLLDVIEKQEIDGEDDIVLLYLTYPQRKWANMQKIHEFYKKNNARTLSCALDVADHPYLCFYELEGSRGRQVVEHSLYRRQDYPPVFRLSLFVAIFKAAEVASFSDLMLNDRTIFYKLDWNVIDIDRDTDMKNFEADDESR